MTQSSSVRLLGPHERKLQSANRDGSSHPTNGVHGWLMDLPGMQTKDDNIETHLPVAGVAAENNSIPTNTLVYPNKKRSDSIASLSSEDSVNLDELINANFTVDVDEETDLPSLADLDLDDSKDDFWKMDDALNRFRATADNDSQKLNKAPSNGAIKAVYHYNKFNSAESDRLTPESPTDAHQQIPSPQFAMRVTSGAASHSSSQGTRNARSGSVSSDNSLQSQSTLKSHQYAQYGMAPVIHPSESTSNSTRSPSRMSNCSISSQASSNASALPRPRTGTSGVPSIIPSPSRSTGRKDKQTLPRSPTRPSTLSPPQAGRTGLTSRATHIPLPASMATANPPPMPTSATRSTGTPGSQSSLRFSQRASHTPRTTQTIAARSSGLSRPASPLNLSSTHRGGTTLFGLRGKAQTSPRSSSFLPSPMDSTHMASESSRRVGSPTFGPKGTRTFSPSSSRMGQSRRL